MNKRIIAMLLASCIFLVFLCIPMMASAVGTVIESDESNIESDVDDGAAEDTENLENYIEKTSNGTMPFNVDAQSVIVLEAKTGQVIMEQNADEQMDVAGTVKLMTALVLMEMMEKGNFLLEDQVSISTTASKAGGMSAFLGSGETYTVEALMRAMMMVNANDAAIALAEKAAGSQDGLLAKMNSRASELGISPVFVNVTGHNADGQRMSARELGVIAQTLVKFERVMEWSKLYTDVIQHPNDRQTELTNPNRMVRFYEGCDGLATGSNKNTNYCSVITAERDGVRYIAIVLGAKNSTERFDISKQLLDYAFANYTPVTVIEAGKGVARDVPVEGGAKKSVHGIAGESLSLVIEKGSEGQIEKIPSLFNETLQAPVLQGDQIGELTIKMGNKEIKKIPILAAEDIESSSFTANLERIINDFIHR